MRDSVGTIVRGNYMVYRFTDQIYKIIKFKCTEISCVRDLSEKKSYDSKLDNSVSRTRRLILEKALCNPWDWFCTLTLDKSKYDRYNLAAFYKDFSQWLRDQRKKGYSVKYLLVPELHDDGAWHLHGFFHGLPELVSFADERATGKYVPDKLVFGGFYNWPAYQEKFGYCSFGRIRSPVRSAFYISKYITKDHGRLVTELGSKMFYCSQGLNKPCVQAEIYGISSEMDSFLQQHYDFCSVGMTKVSDGLDWSFGFDQMDIPFDRMTPLFEDDKFSYSFGDDLHRINLEVEQLSFITESTGDIKL